MTSSRCDLTPSFARNIIYSCNLGLLGSPAASLILVFCARASALGFNQSLWIYTTEVCDRR